MDRLNDILHRIAGVQNLEYFLEEAWHDETSTVELVFHDPPSDFVFVIPESEWANLISAVNVERPEAAAAKQYHSARGRDLLISSGQSHELPKGHSYLVVPIQDIEVWRRSRLVLSWWFQELAEDGLTPPEILDYWMTEELGNAPKEWASQRDVHPEAVRKNVRQARKKLIE
ncbi:hypothetical protein HAL_41200 [Haladaptatus sp. T7]|nr:hypothetical protein HAL_41200 [Haladaptatus sp. T7]